MAKIIIAVMLVLSCFFVLSCNTINGIGKDFQKLGEVIRDSSE